MDAHEAHQPQIYAIAARLQHSLEAVRESISRELCAIPAPVPGCDVHFNRLLEDRSKVVDELQRLGKLRAQGASVDALLGFVRSCTSLDPHTTDRILRDLVGERPSAGGPSR